MGAARSGAALRIGCRRPVHEYAGIAGVGELFGVPRALTVPVAAAFLIGVAMTAAIGGPSGSG